MTPRGRISPRLPRRGLLGLALAAFAATACGNAGPTGVVGGEGVIVQSGGGTARVTNQREASIYYVIFERETLALANWEPCTSDLEGCPISTMTRPC